MVRAHRSSFNPIASRSHSAARHGGDLQHRRMPGHQHQMEAMKLIHMLKATAPGRIEAIRCAVGDSVPAGAVLVEIAPVEIKDS